MNFSELDIQKYADLTIELLIQYTPKLLLALLTLVVGWFLIKHFIKVLDKIFHSQKLDPSLSGFIHSLVSIGLKLILLITVAGMVGVQMTSFIALLGAAGLAVGLALQGSLANFAGGVLILFFKPFKVGDYIEAAGGEGYVQQIQIFSTILKTRGDQILVLPNGDLSNNPIENYSTLKKRRVDIDLGVGYNSDIDQVREILLKIMKDHPDIPDTPEPRVMVHELGDSAVIMRCRCWMLTPKSFRVRYDINESAKRAFDKAGVSIPFPQRDVHLYQTKK